MKVICPPSLLASFLPNPHPHLHPLSPSPSLSHHPSYTYNSMRATQSTTQMDVCQLSLVSTLTSFFFSFPFLSFPFFCLFFIAFPYYLYLYILTDPNNNNVTVWESGAILQYIQKRYDPENKLGAKTAQEEADLLSFLFFQVSGHG